MFSTPLVSLALLVAFCTASQATVVTWYTARNCDSESEGYRVGCNTCVDPTGGMAVIPFVVGRITDFQAIAFFRYQ